MSSPHSSQTSQLYAYVDETGDLGARPGKASRYFGMAGILLDEKGAGEAREFIENLKDEFNVPDWKNFSWKEHVRKHERRKYISQRMGELENIQVIYVFTDKDRLNGEYVNERARLYNYVAGEMLKSLCWAAREWNREAPLSIRYSHVKNLDHNGATKPYFEKYILPNLSEILPLDIKWVDARNFKESDLADLFAGCLYAAINQDEYGNREGAYLRNVWPLVNKSEPCETSEEKSRTPLGFTPLPEYNVVDEFDWFVDIVRNRF
ncbi:DUF3800 domain-containing protein [Trueperella bialowiezensis]|uniref:Protein of uncharacterized function (DUF3800) n=1 Tax=Trueperella bialowiezensis TaxID=312285 RepID=A0A3S4VSY1_9ACTO|nr:DUF3800 domain-containing protein [Trueperella bialowiezensis]VEI13015.1 Protein of uncharacterised function (DUF3800) [Trueperella bialowiezensis]